MDTDHDCTSACGGICHLNEAAQDTYLGLIARDRVDEAEALRARGVMPAAS